MAASTSSGRTLVAEQGSRPSLFNMKRSRLTELSGPVVVAIGIPLLPMVAGCQSTTTGTYTTPRHDSGTASKATTTNATLVANPRPVSVREFAFDVAQLHSDQGVLAGRQGPAKRILGSLRSEETSAQKAPRFAGLLSETIAKELADLKIPASREPQAAPWPLSGLVVSGQFMQVDEGNRLKRAVIGFGAGATEVLVQVAVYDLAQSREQPILVYGTGTGSKPMPGAVVTLNPFAMAAKYVLSRNANEKDVRKLGKQIAKDLAQVEAGGVPKR
jgi:hypothetical protein